MIYITAIKPATASTYKGITHYRWLNGETGKAGTSDRVAMVAFLEKKDNRAQVAGEGGPAEVGIRDDDGTRYLQTHADGSWNNNLLQLPRI